ncbi:unnamed protein product [Arctogadus glacialis]
MGQPRPSGSQGPHLHRERGPEGAGGGLRGPEGGRRGPGGGPEGGRRGPGGGPEGAGRDNASHEGAIDLWRSPQRLKAPPALTNLTPDPCSSERLCVSLGNQRTHEEPFSLLETRSQASPSHWWSWSLKHKTINSWSTGMTGPE